MVMETAKAVAMAIYSRGQKLSKVLQCAQIRKISLFRDNSFVNGEWIGASTRAKYPVLNPYNGKKLTDVPDCDVQDAKTAINKAHEGFESYQLTTAKERGNLLRKLYNLLISNQDEVAKIITAECGKPVSESKAEVAYTAAYIEWYSEEAKRIYGEMGPAPSRTRELIYIREPIGVVGMITPWNFPLAMLGRKMSAALACGCTCVARPAETTPLSALALAALVEEAGFPSGSFNVITSSRQHAAVIGKTLCESEQVSGISFTGSSAVGKILYKQCGKTIKKIALELGGNAPLLVFPSADLENAVQGIMASKFRNAGQACVASNRIFVHEELMDRIIPMLQNAMKKTLVPGDPMNPETTLGPLANRQQLDKVEALLNDAAKKGAKILEGGTRHPFGGLFFTPTLITDVTPEMDIYEQEVFGPILPLYRFSSEEEGLKLANSTRGGLASYFYSQDYQQIWRVSKKLQAGMVGVNEGLISAAEVPFGGVKESGIGREGSRHGIDEYTHIKYICMGGLNN